MVERIAIGTNLMFHKKGISPAKETTPVLEMKKTKPASKQKPISTDLHISKSTYLHISKPASKTSRAKPMPAQAKEGKVKVNLWVDDALFDKIKVASIKKETKISDYVASQLLNSDKKITKVTSDQTKQKGKVQLCLILPKSIILNLKMEAFKLKVPYLSLIAEKLR